MQLTACLFITWIGAISAEANGAGTPPESADARITVFAGQPVRDNYPEELFGFNINHYRFEKDFISPDGTIAPSIIEHLKEFPGAMYRYPGGLVANRFWWERSIGPVNERQAQHNVDHAAAAPVTFGVEEYLDFVKAVGGQSWYVLNLFGWSAERDSNEMPALAVADSAANLVAFIRENSAENAPRYYQLGNELDRAEYEWPTDKYIQRSRAVIEAVRSKDSQARFVAFLRDFDWTYKRGTRKGTKSRFTDFIPEVLKGLPMVEDFSLHFYYDDPGLGKNFKTIGWRLRQFRKAIDAARRARNGGDVNVWITEHARGVNLAAGKAMERSSLTSNLSATVSTADFLIGIALMPEVKGAFWHGLNAGPWQVFDATIRYEDLRPRPVYWGLRVLRSVELPIMLKTDIQSQPPFSYAGGYDIRAVGLTDESHDTLGLWIANRKVKSAAVDVIFEPMADAAVSIEHRHVSAPGEGDDPNDPRLSPVVELSPTPATARFSTNGTLTLKLPPSSVSGIIIHKTGSGGN